MVKGCLAYPLTSDKSMNSQQPSGDGERPFKVVLADRMYRLPPYLLNVALPPILVGDQCLHVGHAKFRVNTLATPERSRQSLLHPRP